jgi:CRISPR-associated endonuclease/helicase Cas3
VHGLGEDVAALAAQALALLARSGCGAVIVNTVDRAQQLYRLLRGALGPQVPVLLFHARFPMEDRQAIETQVLRCFGPDGDRPAQALLVATQVAEQSLDIDFDFMLSDLAPVDCCARRAPAPPHPRTAGRALRRPGCGWPGWCRVTCRS